MRMTSTYTPKRKSNSSTRSSGSKSKKSSTKKSSNTKKKSSTSSKSSSTSKSKASRTPPPGPGWSDDRKTWWGMEIGADGRPKTGWGGGPLAVNPSNVTGYRRATTSTPRVMRNRRK